MSEKNGYEGWGARDGSEATHQLPALETPQAGAAGEAPEPRRRRRADKYHQEENAAPVRVTEEDRPAEKGMPEDSASSGLNPGVPGRDAGEPESATARYTAVPMIESASETAREMASRIRMQEAPAGERTDPRGGEAERPAGLTASRVPPQAARMSEAARNRMEASRQRAGAEREKVGYAPGRMGAKRPPYGSRAGAPGEWEPAGAAVPRGGQKPPARKGEAPRRSHRGLTVAVIALLVLGLLVLGIHLIPNDAGGIPGAVKSAVTGWLSGTAGTGEKPASGVISFVASGNENAMAPTEVNFLVTVTKDVQDVQLVDKDGTVQNTRRKIVDNSEQTVLNLIWPVDKAYEGQVYLQVMMNWKWVDTNMSALIKVISLESGETESEGPGAGETAEADGIVKFWTDAPTDTPAPTMAPEEPEATAVPTENQDAERENVGEDLAGSAPMEEAGEDTGPTPEPTTGNRTRRERATATPAAEDNAAAGAEESAGAEATIFAWIGAEETLAPEPEEGTDGEEPEAVAGENDGEAEGPEENEPEAPAEDGAEAAEAGTEEAENASETEQQIAESGDAGAAAESGDAGAAAEAGKAGEAEEAVKLTAKACEAADPSLMTTSVIYNGNKKASEYSRPERELITMPVGGEYTRKAEMGILTFRTDAFRQNAAYGTVPGANALEQVWKAEAGAVKGSSQTYYGIGWVGQPAIVKWSKEVREKCAEMYSGKRETSALKEVIIGGLDGNIYFLDLADGGITRNSIKLGFPMKGSASVHPSGAPYFNIGQYARKMAKGTGKIGLRQYNLYTQKEMTLIDGLDGTNRRYSYDVGSFETSALIDRNSNTLVTAGTNGLLYVISMGDTFDYQMGVYTQSPSQVLLKSKTKAESEADTAVEASVAMYDRYVFYADMGGVLRCVDTNTMKVVWAVETGDSVESTPALRFNGEGGLDLFTANLLNRRKSGDATVRCYDAMSGEEKWATAFGVVKDKKNKTASGFRASPVIGQNGLSGLVYYTVNNLSEEGADALGQSGAEAALVAMDAGTGRILWSRSLSGRGYSSPVAVYDEAGNGWIIQCAGDGSILLLNGLDGRVINSLTVEGSIEGSPAVYEDMMVVGTTQKGANYIYGIRIQ